MESKQNLGKTGEDIACGYLVGKKYKIIERNFRRKWGELDIIAKSPDRTLVFVEVKTMKYAGETGLQPEDQLSTSKLEKLKRTSSLYAGEHEELIDDKKGWRIDLLSLTIYENRVVIRHHENIS